MSDNNLKNNPFLKNDTLEARKERIRQNSKYFNYGKHKDQIKDEGIEQRDAYHKANKPDKAITSDETSRKFMNGVEKEIEQRDAYHKANKPDTNKPDTNKPDKAITSDETSRKFMDDNLDEVISNGIAKNNPWMQKEAERKAARAAKVSDGRSQG